MELTPLISDKACKGLHWLVSVCWPVPNTLERCVERVSNSKGRALCTVVLGLLGFIPSDRFNVITPPTTYLNGIKSVAHLTRPTPTTRCGNSTKFNIYFNDAINAEKQTHKNITLFYLFIKLNYLIHKQIINLIYNNKYLTF